MKSGASRLGMAIFHLPNGLDVEVALVYRDPGKPSNPLPPEPTSEVTPEPDPSSETLLEKATRAVEDVVKPKTRRGRPKKTES